MYKWKYDQITDVELNMLYAGIKDILWHHINPTCCHTPRMDMFQSLWLHLGTAKAHWNENACNKVTSWMWLVVQNFVKNVKYYEVRERNLMTNFSEFGDGIEDQDNVMNRFCDCRRGRSMVSDAVLEWESKQSDLWKKIIELIIDPDNDTIGMVNSRKKYFSKKISKSDMASILSISKGELANQMSLMKVSLKEFMDDYAKLLVYQR